MNPYLLEVSKFIRNYFHKDYIHKEILYNFEEAFLSRKVRKKKFIKNYKILGQEQHQQRGIPKKEIRLGLCYPMLNLGASVLGNEGKEQEIISF
jgi:hypothetical protein